MNECKRIIGNKIAYYNNKYDALANADALVLLTEWQEFRLPDWDLVGKTMHRKLILDGRNIYDYDDLTEHGLNIIV